MKGPDGVAEREYVNIDTALNNVVVVAAPPAGFYICGFKLMGTAAGPIYVLDGIGGPRVWGIAPTASRPFYDGGDCGIFALTAAAALVLENASLAIVRGNLAYEIRPDGI